uniref:Uncharacterized protein n=1 Tax=Steinernema glaseri TaxID=37863 RepID=A0A1I7Y882_9BILA
MGGPPRFPTSQDLEINTIYHLLSPRRTARRCEITVHSLYRAFHVCDMRVVRVIEQSATLWFVKHRGSGLSFLLCSRDGIISDWSPKIRDSKVLLSFFGLVTP